jgi:beta-glucosidase/6-phospho-beta-glucosidase/beta-galactosidase
MAPLDAFRLRGAVSASAGQAGDGMPYAIYHFSAEFQWGIATTAHQVGGKNVDNNSWAREQAEGHIEGGQTSDIARDWWENRDADLVRLATRGANTLRLSVGRSCDEPHFGLIALDQQTRARTQRRAVQLYRDLLRANASIPQLVDTCAPDLRPDLLPGLDR